MALLPKLHVNCHTARSIIFGGEKYGGLALPNPYITQGVDKLRLFLGHLRFQDRTGQLIFIDMSYIQLLLGIGTLFFNKDETQFKWGKTGWLQSLWSFTTRYSLKCLYPKGWVPSKPRSQDQLLMEVFQQHRHSVADMKALNHCWLYLNVLFISDITTAEGRTIDHNIKKGQKLVDRESTLLWPTQGKPSPKDWQVWKQHLGQLEHKGKLIVPLGLWINSTHQKWRFVADNRTRLVYDTKPDHLMEYIPLPAPRPLRSGYWYDRNRGRPINSIPAETVPATIMHNTISDGNLFQITTSSNTIPAECPYPTVSIARSYYEKLLPADETAIPYQAIMETETLHISVSSQQEVDKASPRLLGPFNQIHFSTQGATQRHALTIASS
jgi:hypothetical protein